MFDTSTSHLPEYGEIHSDKFDEIRQLSAESGWLDPQGVLHPVRFCGHAQFTFEALSSGLVDKETFLEAGDCYNGMYANKWMRLSFGEWSRPVGFKMSQKQREFVERWSNFNRKPVPDWIDGKVRRMPVTPYAFI